MPDYSISIEKNESKISLEDFLILPERIVLNDLISVWISLSPLPMSILHSQIYLPKKPCFMEKIIKLKLSISEKNKIQRIGIRYFECTISSKISIKNENLISIQNILIIKI